MIRYFFPIAPSCAVLLQGYLRQALGNAATVYSAGVEVCGVNPCAVRVMAEDGVNSSNHVDEYAHIPFDYVLAVCDHANEGCPLFISSGKKLRHIFPDPVQPTGSEEEIMNQFHAVRDQVKAYPHRFVRAQPQAT